MLREVVGAMQRRANVVHIHGGQWVGETINAERYIRYNNIKHTEEYSGVVC